MSMKDEETSQKQEESTFILRLNDEQRKMVQEGLEAYKRGEFYTTEEMFGDLLGDEEGNLNPKS